MNDYLYGSYHLAVHMPYQSKISLFFAEGWKTTKETGGRLLSICSVLAILFTEVPSCRRCTFIWYTQIVVKQQDV